MKALIIATACAAALGLGGCSATTAQFNKNAKWDVGPSPEILQSENDALACVASRLTPQQRKLTFAVMDFRDDTGMQNTNGSGDSLGYVNGSGARAMLISALAQAGIAQTDTADPNMQNLYAWQKNVLGNVKGLLVPGVVLRGSISAGGIMPGGGAGLGFGGVELSSSQFRVGEMVTLYAVDMPLPDQVGGRIITATQAVKQMPQQNLDLSASRFTKIFGSNTSLLNAYVGSQRRELVQFGIQSAVRAATAALLAKKFGVQGCLPPPTPERQVIAQVNPPGR